MEFVVPALDEYVDLSRCYFSVKLTLRKSDGGNIVNDTNLWPVPNLAHSVIKQVTVNLNGILISHQTDTYPYKAYLETLLNYDKQEADAILKLACKLRAQHPFGNAKALFHLHNLLGPFCKLRNSIAMVMAGKRKKKR